MADQPEKRFSFVSNAVPADTFAVVRFRGEKGRLSVLFRNDRDSTRLSVPTVTKALEALEELGVVREITGRQRGRLYSYRRYLDLLNQEPRRRSLPQLPQTRSRPRGRLT